MARARLIKPDFFMDCDVASCSIEARLLFMALWCMAENSGHVHETEEEIKEFAFQFDDVDIPSLLNELEASRLVDLTSRSTVYIPNFEAWCGPFPKPQNVSRASSARRARKKKAAVAWADMDAIDAIYAKCQRISEETNIKHQVDHIVPLAGDNVCGLHVENNLQIITASENARKGKSFPEPNEGLS